MSSSDWLVARSSCKDMDVDGTTLECEITDSAGHPVMMMTGDNPEDRGDRGSTRDPAKEESH